jgi:hypothetical protein
MAQQRTEARCRHRPAALALLVALAAGCVPSAGTRQPGWAQGQQGPMPSFFPGCATAAGDNLHGRGFAAIVVALEESGWALDRVDPRNKYVSARACAADDPDLCAEVGFQANLRGDVKATPVVSVDRSFEDELKQRMIALERSFASHSCEDDDALGEGVAKHGLSL